MLHDMIDKQDILITVIIYGLDFYKKQWTAD